MLRAEVRAQEVQNSQGTKHPFFCEYMENSALFFFLFSRNFLTMSLTVGGGRMRVNLYTRFPQFPLAVGEQQGIDTFVQRCSIPYVPRF